ncbi:MAG: hypothetical protein KQI62_02280 [Deltaproteobacteria bacterium]|nr:hypothetical protein [Deltaproteobacteria bacterium]
MAEYSGSDYLGADLALADGDVIHGDIYGVRELVVPEGATIDVKPFDGVDYGEAVITCRRLRVVGTGSATRAGHGPGGGAGAGWGGCHDGDTLAQPGLGSRDGEDGLAPPGTFPPGHYGESGVAGGQGGGPHGGAPGAGGEQGGDSGEDHHEDGDPGTPGEAGGYKAAASNGDTTTDQSVQKGSAGGGTGSGGGGGSKDFDYDEAAGGGAGAPAGGFGGGVLKIICLESGNVPGKLESRGTLDGGDGDPGDPGAATAGYGNGGDGGDGGDADTPGNGLGALGGAAGGPTVGAGGPSPDGAPGAGGGICLICQGPWPLTITGEIDTRGGGDNETNFGSCKLFGVKVNTTGATLNTGHNDVFGVPLVVENQMWAHPVC